MSVRGELARLRRMLADRRQAEADRAAVATRPCLRSMTDEELDARAEELRRDLADAEKLAAGPGEPEYDADDIDPAELRRMMSMTDAELDAEIERLHREMAAGPAAGDQAERGEG